MTSAWSCASIPALAPFKAAVLPLSKKLGDKGREIQDDAVQVLHGGL